MKNNADAIGLSGLLVKSVGVMEQNLHELNMKINSNTSDAWRGCIHTALG